MTAVNWLEEAITENLKEIITKCNVELMELLFIKAKAMEKEQIIKAYEITKFGIFAMTDTGILDTANKSGEQYYNEIFKSE